MKKTLFTSLRPLALAAASLSLFTAPLPVQAEGAHGHGAHWGYSGDAGPMHWGDLNAEYALCKGGKGQSPIDIGATEKVRLDDIRIDYKSGATEVVNNGHTIQVNVPKGSSVTVNGKRYELLQFHFHTPSEHTVNGKPADMVAHLVHKAADGQLGVIGVLMKKGKKNATVATVWERMPRHAGEKASLKGVKLKVSGLLPSDHAYYNYSGSLTTPPCSEGVNWMVLEQPVQVSADQVASFSALFHNNARPVQPLNGRLVKASR